MARIALVTGASKGVGRGIAYGLAEDGWDVALNYNGDQAGGTFLCTQAAAQAMLGRGGSIVNIGSGCNSVPFPHLVDYTASKGGIENFTKVAAVELGRFGIRVNCVAPGAVEIERTKLESPDYAGTWGSTPLGRVGQVEDVARAVAFLASERASFITGQTLFVDGGVCMQALWPAPREGEIAYGIPNLASVSSRYCGNDSHQAIRQFEGEL